MHDLYVHLLLLVTGAFAGTINSLAGSGSLVTLPALIAAGLSVRDANATNRVGVLVQNVSAIVAYGRAGAMPWRILWRLAIPSAAGALAGSLVAARIGQAPMKIVIGAAMVMATVATVLYRPKKKPPAPSASPSPSAELAAPVSPAPSPSPDRLPTPLAYVAFLGVGFYAGLAQVGLGLIVLAVAPRLLGVDLVRANALKVGVVLVSQVVAISVFTTHGQIDPVPAVALSAGSLLGGWLGARLAVARGDAFVRVIVLVAGVGGIVMVVGSLMQ